MTDGTTAWQTATVTNIVRETERAMSFRLRLTEPRSHISGQHYVVRLTAPDGYVASRSYSIASPPGDPSEIVLTVERLDDGEVSTFLHDVVEIGDELEVRGPIGTWFTWDGETPSLLVGGGSGLVPLVSMLRHARLTGRADRLHLVASVRAPADLLYADELVGPEVVVVYSRTAPSGVARRPGRLVRADLPHDLAVFARILVCGSNGFANHVTTLLAAAGVPADRIRVERFGPSG